MKIKKSLFVVLAMSMLSTTLAACGPNKSDGSLNVSIQYQNTGTGIKYATGDNDNKVFKEDNANAYTHKYRETATGETKTITFNKGDFKPTWQKIQSNLNIKLNDVTDFSQTKIADAFKTWQSKGFKGVDIAQGNADSINTQGTSSPGSILNLADYLDRMPNFSKFLSDNPAIEAFIKNSEGAMYYAPYFDGFNDIERMLMMRFDWVQFVLDGENDDLIKDTTANSKVASKSYTPFYAETETKKITVVKADGTGTEELTKKKTGNIITLQNATDMTPKKLIEALRSYIDTTFVKADGTKYYSKRSDLFIGQNAAYDIDELVALFRCIKSLPVSLTGDTNDIVPLYPRDDTNDRIADLWRFTQFFGVRGGESRNGYLYVGSDGKLHDARNEEDMIKAVEKLNQMYNEGLILQKFDEDKATGAVDDTEHRKDLLKGNRGFATYDYNQTTTILNKQIATGKNAQNPLKDKYTPLLGSTLPAVAKWNGSDEYSFFTESWRSVKTEGWFISGEVAKDEAKLTNALKLFDYFFSEEGNRLMSYGPDEYLEHDDKGEIVYIDYQGKKVPQLSKETKEELANNSAGNYTNYYRYWLGATLPVGYVKEQGMEYQTVVDVAKPSLDNVNNAIALGVLKHVNFKADNEDKFYNIVPTSFAYNQGESNQITSNFNGLNDYINNTKGKNNTWTYIVEKGYGANDKGKETPANREAYFAKLKELNIKDYLSINQTAYDRQVDFMTKNAKKQNAFIVTKEDFAE